MVCKYSTAQFKLDQVHVQQNTPQHTSHSTHVHACVCMKNWWYIKSTHVYMHKMCALWAHVLAKYVHAKLLCIVCITILSQEQWYKFHKHARILRSDLCHVTDDNATSLPILKAGLSNFYIVSCIQYILGIGINLLYTHTGIYLRISNGNWYKTHLQINSTGVS